MPVLIIADDLTGAADCAAATHAPAIVGLDGPAATAPVVAIDIDSRDRPAAEAGARAAAALHRGFAPDGLVYHKMDSTLRGNWPAELAAIRAALAGRRDAAPLVVLCPAFPERGRRVEGGRLLAGDDTGRDRGPIDTPLRGTGLEARTVPRLPDEAALAAALADARRAGADIVICDAGTRSDLDRIAAAGLALDAPALWCGSAGLMGSLAGRLGLPPLPAPQPAAPDAGTVLVVVGSAAPLSHRQLDRLRAGDGIRMVAWPADRLAGAGAADSESMRGEVVAAMTGARCVAVAIDGGATMPAGGAALVAGLTRIVAPLLPRFGGLVLTGGETARALLAAAGISAIRITGDIEAGVPLGRTLGALERPLVTKAGAFGSPDVLVRAVAALSS